MEITGSIDVTVRRDLDTDDLFDYCCFPTDDIDGIKRLISQNFGGHRLQFKTTWHKVGELKSCLVPKAKKRCFDHQTCYKIIDNPIHTKHLTKSGKRVDAMAIHEEHPAEIETVKMSLVNPVDEWNWEDVIIFMHENGLRPASFYEHMSFCAEHFDRLEGKTAVPFGAYVNPMRYTCSGLALIKKGKFWWQEGGGNYSRGVKRIAKFITFTATEVGDFNTSLFN